MAKEARLAVRMDQRELEAAHAAAEEQGTTLSDLVRRLLWLVSLGLIRLPDDNGWGAVPK